MQRNYRFRLYPTKAQEAALNSMLEAFCDLYNAALQERADCYRKTGRSLSYYDQARELKEVREVDSRLGSYSFSAQQQLLRRVDKAYKSFFARIKRGTRAGFPRFKSNRHFDSIEFRVGDGLTLKKTNVIGLKGLAGVIKVKQHREIPANAKLGHAIISRNGGHWHASFLVTLPDLHLCPVPMKPVGIDVGLTNLIALSNGTTERAPKWMKNAASGLRRHQRQLARRRKGSKRYGRARLNLARYCRRIANQRRDFMHKLTTDLVRTYTHFAVEDLNLLGLAQGVLAKDILNASWGEFFQMLHYKAESAGGAVEAINPCNTSQTCSACGSIALKKLSEREHHCPFCGYRTDRDVNAAQNILRKSSFLGLGSSLRTQSGPDCRAKLVREAVYRCG
jgi:putative transposase